MAALPYMPLYVADYLADTAHLGALEHGAYLMLIMNYWQRGKPLPADDERLRRIARVEPGQWDAVKMDIAEFFVEIDGEWRHSRIESELARVAEKSTKARASAQRSHSVRSASAVPTPCYTDTDTDTREEIEDAPRRISPRKSADGIKAKFAGILSDDMASAVVAHRKAKKAPLTEKAAELLAKRFSETVNPEAAAAMMIERGWQGFDPSWAGELPRVVTLMHTGPPPVIKTDAELIAELEALEAEDDRRRQLSL